MKKLLTIPLIFMFLSPITLAQESEVKIPTILAIIGAAAVDAINPCAFAVLIILLSTMLAIGERLKALKAGFAYIVSIYIAYFFMGLGIFSVIMVSKLALIFYKAVGVLALIVGALNIKDFFRYGGGGFLMEVPVSWRPKMKSLIGGVTSIPGAFITGFVVSLFLLPCTSGPYIVILGLLAKEATKLLATQLLLFYNFIFILPMIGIVLAVYYGLTTTDKAEKWRQSKLRTLHLIAGIIMVCMGIWMIFFY